MFPTLETERLILREITKNDSNAIFSCFSNEDVTRYYGQEKLNRIEQAEELVDFFSNSYKEKKEYVGELNEKEFKILSGRLDLMLGHPNINGQK